MDPLDFPRFDPDVSSPRVVAAYDELPLWSAMFGLFLLDEVPLKGAQVVLDVGCGTGFPLIELAERLGSDAHVHGLDLWSAGLRRAAEKIASRGLSNVKVHEGSATMMPFADTAFDLIVSNLGVSNFAGRTRAIRECRRVAKVGGIIAVTTNLQGHMQELYAVFEDVLNAAGDREGCRRLRDLVAHRATSASIGELLETNGFSVTRVVERTSRVRFVNGSALLHHHFVKLAFLAAWRTVRPDREADIFPRLLDKLDECSGHAGELTLTIPMAYIEGAAI